MKPTSKRVGFYFEGNLTVNWAYAYDPRLWPALITFALVVFLGWYSWRRRRVPGAKPFAVGCVFAALWTLGIVLEISASDPSSEVFWVKFQAAWQLPTATALTCFILVYAGLGRWVTRRNLVLLAIPPVLFLGLIATNEYHHLVWTGFRIEEYVIPSQGTGSRLFLIYGYILALVNLIVLLRLAIRSPQYHWPVAILLFGQIAGRGVYLLDYFYAGWLGPGEFVLVVLGLMSSAYAIALFRFHVFDPVALARSAVIEQMREGMLVLDADGHIVDLNPAATKILSELGVGPGRGSPRKMPQVITDFLSKPEKARETPFEISLGRGNDPRYYDLDFIPLIDRYDQVRGQLLVLHDVTEQKKSQEQILEQQRAVAALQERERLGRELHDGTAQVLAYVKLQTDNILKCLEMGNNEKAKSMLCRVASAVREAHSDIRDSIHSLTAGSHEEWSFMATLERYLKDFQAQSGIRTELVLVDGLKGGCFKPEAEIQLLRVIQEAAMNAYKHSGAHAVRLTIEQSRGQGRVTVTDDGTGFAVDQVQQKAGRHFGLAFMRERMEEIGGSIVIDSRPGAGTIIKLAAPLKQSPEEGK